MLILAIDTAGKTVSAALADEQQIIGRLGLNTGRTHSQKLLPLVDSLLGLTEVKLSDLSAVAVTIGPGSFTGLRIGLATAKAWAEALDLPLIAVPTLAAAARGCGGDGYICPIMDARKNQVYAVLFQGRAEIWSAQALSLDELTVRLADIAAPITFCGDAVTVYADELAMRLGDRLLLAEEDKRLFMADGAVLLAREMLIAGQVSSAETIEPFYLRRSEAEQTLRAKEEKHD